MTELQVDVYIAPIISAQTGNPDPLKQLWSPISCTLIQGPTSAVLVDTPITIDQTKGLIGWIERTLLPGRKLMHLYITHAHGDHFFGTPVLQERFTDLQMISTVRVAEGIKQQYSPAWYDDIWKVSFPDGQIHSEKPMPDVLPQSNEFFVDGYVFRGVDLSHTDCEHSSVLHVPDLELIVGGDVIYGDCYQHLGEANTPALRQAWIDSLNLIEQQLKPKVVVAGHTYKGPRDLKEARVEKPDNAERIQDTRRYIETFNEKVRNIDKQLSGKAQPEKALELERQMKEAYPGRWNAYILEWSCLSAFQS